MQSLDDVLQSCRRCFAISRRCFASKKKCNQYLDDVFMQSQNKGGMFIILEQYHQILKNKKMKAAPDKSHFFSNTRKVSWTHY